MSVRNYYNGNYRLEKRNDDPPTDGGRYSYDEPIFIGCYRRKKMQVIKTGQSQTIQSNATYATEDSELRTGDKIDDMVIIAIDAPNGGNVQYWRAYV